MTINLDTLRKTAEAATPGPWETLGGQGPFGTHAVCHRMEQGTLVEIAYRDAHFDKANAVHIATFDPPTVLALLSRLEQAEQAVQRVREMATELRDTPASPESPKYARLLIEGAQAAGADMLRALDGGTRSLADDALTARTTKNGDT